MDKTQPVFYDEGALANHVQIQREADKDACRVNVGECGACNAGGELIQPTTSRDTRIDGHQALSNLTNGKFIEASPLAIR